MQNLSDAVRVVTELMEDLSRTAARTRTYAHTEDSEQEAPFGVVVCAATHGHALMAFRCD